MRSMLMVLVLFAVGQMSLAQDTLTLNDAIALGLSNNYNIQMVAIDKDAAALNNAAGNAGMLPSIELRVADQYSSNNILQRFSNGTEITSPNANGNNLTAAVAASWTVFDGLKMFATREKLTELEKISGIQLQQQMATTIRDITVAYSAMQQLQLREEYLTTLISFNELRKDITEIRFSVGNGSKTDFLQAFIDLNSSKAQLIDTRNQLVAANANLKNIIRDKSPNTIVVSSSTPITEIDFENIKEKIKRDNYAIELANKNVIISSLQVKETKAASLPSLTLNGSYNLNRTDNSAGFSLFNRSFGPQVGATLILPIFNGGQLNRSIQLSKLELKQSELWLDQVSMEIQTKSDQLIAQASNLLELQKIYQQSLDMSTELLSLALDRFKQGQSNSLEVQQAQLAFDNVNSLFLENNYQLQITLSELKLLAGDIE